MTVDWVSCVELFFLLYLVWSFPQSADLISICDYRKLFFCPEWTSWSGVSYSFVSVAESSSRISISLFFMFGCDADCIAFFYTVHGLSVSRLFICMHRFMLVVITIAAELEITVVFSQIVIVAKME